MSTKNRLIALRGLAASGLWACALAAGAQTASNTCGYDTGNQYPVGTACTGMAFNKPDAFTATFTATGCSGSNNDDAWGWFTATSTRTVVSYINTTNNRNPIIHVYTGACGSLTAVGCVNAGGNNTRETLVMTTTVGQNYMIRIQHQGGNNPMDGTICIFNQANDEPCGATPLTVNSSCSHTTYTNLGATNTTSVSGPGCASYSGSDVWFTVVAPAWGSISVETGSASGLTDTGIAFYSATSCSTGFSLIECNDDAAGLGLFSRITRTGLTPGTTYYVRVWGYGGEIGNFNICAYTGVPPANDEPCAATVLTLGTSCSYASQTNAWSSVSSGMPAPGCGTGIYNDVWYRFTAPASALATFRVTTGTLANPQMAVYHAPSCSGTFTLVKCDNASGPGDAPFMTLTPLDIIPGETYYVRIWGNGGTTGTFNLCAFTAPTGTSCVYALRMWDSMGDGWGASRVSISVGGGPATDYWVSNADEDVAYIPVNTGQMVTVSYSTGGSGGQAQIRYALQLMNGALYMDGPTPGTGPRWAGTANCISPSALSSDCRGSVPICGTQSFNGSPSNTGLAVDLNFNNRGCLNANERQGIWYQFTVSASGTLGFTISPNNSGDDYDFAVFGPFSGTQCPPRNTPVRCNYSGDAGDTGLSASGTNPSEGAGGNKWSTRLPVTSGEVYHLYISNFSQSGLAFSLSWQLTGGASLDCTLLPVELLSLTGAPVPEGIRLDWLTASEQNSAFFAVERMHAMGEFQQIGELPAAGTSSATLAYQFLDTQPLPGFNHYRLKMIDLDGTAKLSDAIAVANRYGSFVGSLFPNPASDRINVPLGEGMEGDLSIAVVDASGRQVRALRAAIAAGQHVLTVPLHGLEPGHYALSIITPEGALIPAGRFVLE
jgi:hypothetical protein